MFGWSKTKSLSPERCGRDDEVQRSSERPVGLWARWCLRADPRPLLLLELALPLWYFWEYRAPAAAMVAVANYVGACLGIVLFGFLAIGRAVQVLLQKSCAARYRVDADRFRSPRRFWAWFIMIAAATCLMMVFRVPLYLSFLLSRPALDRVAERALADPDNADDMANEWAGVYRIAGVRVIGSTVVVYVGKRHADYGFAQVPGAPGDLVFNRFGAEDLPGFYRDFPRADLGNPVGRRIADDWFLMYSSYWVVRLQRGM